jgi:hypothetical protein
LTLKFLEIRTEKRATALLRDSPAIRRRATSLFERRTAHVEG